MTLDLNAVGRIAGPAVVSWDERDVMLYALGVGAGQEDATKELSLTTENSAGIELQALPTYSLAILQRAGLRPDIGSIDRTQFLHAEQTLTMHQPLPVQGSVQVTATITFIQDKGSGALVATDSEARDTRTGELMFVGRSTAFIRGEGGFDPNRQAAPKRQAEQRPAPDFETRVITRQDQALLYRLSADRNPMHSDPAFAARGGFQRPILHGLGTFGIATRTLLNNFAPDDPGRLAKMFGRFRRSVIPGDELVIQAWKAEDRLNFCVRDVGGNELIEDGWMTWRNQ